MRPWTVTGIVWGTREEWVETVEVAASAKAQSDPDTGREVYPAVALDDSMQEAAAMQAALARRYGRGASMRRDGAAVEILVPVTAPVGGRSIVARLLSLSARKATT